MAASKRKENESYDEYRARLKYEQRLIDQAARGTAMKGTGAPMGPRGDVIVNNRAARRAQYARDTDRRRTRG